MKFKLGDRVRVKDELYGSNSKIADSLEPYEEERDANREYKVGDRVVAIDNLGLNLDGSRGTIIAIFRNPPRNDEFDYLVKYDDACGKLWSKIVSLESDSISADTSETPVVAPPVHGKESVLESKMEYPSIVITCKGRKTKAVLRRGDVVLRRASASCHPEDDFDQYVGASIALDRLFDRPVDVDAHEHTKHSAMPKPFEGKAVCVARNELNDAAKYFTVGRGYEFRNGKVSCDDGSSYFTASTFDGNWEWLGVGFIPFIEDELTTRRYEGTIICVDSDAKGFTPGKAYKVNDGCIYNDNGVLTSKVESDNIDGLNDEFEAIGVLFVEMVE